jgi:FAD/FMN-containing dehydrogenase
MYDANQPGELERATAFGAEILELSVRFGGTITGEHGVGIEKIMLMAEQFSLAEIDAFHRLKAAFDEHGLLNPGKGVPTLARCREYTQARAGTARHFAEAVMDTLIDDWIARISRSGQLAAASWRFAAAAASRSTAARKGEPSRSAATGHRRLRADRTGGHRARRNAARRTGRDAGRERAVAALRAAAFRAGGDRRRHAGERPVGPAPAGGGGGARFRSRRQAAERSGEVLSFGGQVMKNVAGYDVPRLMAGSLGTLGVVLEVSLKVLPLPVAEKSLRFAIDEAAALQKLNQWGGRPLPISASAWHDGVLTLRLSGAAAAVAAAQRTLAGRGCWTTPRRRVLAVAARADARLLCRRCAAVALSLPSVAPPQALGPTLIEWGGAQRWLRGGDAAAIRAAAARPAGTRRCFARRRAEGRGRRLPAAARRWRGFIAI